MTITHNVIYWPGGGVWGINQFVYSDAWRDVTGSPLSAINSFNATGSVGTIPAVASILPEDRLLAHSEDQPDIIEVFKRCSEEMMGAGRRDEQLIKSVTKDLHHLSQDSRIRRIIFKDHQDGFHLNHEVLSTYLKGPIGDARLSDLTRPISVYAHDLTDNDRVAFTAFNNLHPILDTAKWSGVKDLGADHSAIDTIMMTTAAPTVFKSRQIADGQIIDLANLCSPANVVRNIFRMTPEDRRKETRVNIIIFGTGDLSGVSTQSAPYDDLGPLRMMSGLVTSMSCNVLKNEMAELNADYPNQITTTHFDIAVSEIAERFSDFRFDSFNGDIDYLNLIHAEAIRSAQKQSDLMKVTAEKILETQESEAAIDCGTARATNAFMNGANGESGNVPLWRPKLLLALQKLIRRRQPTRSRVVAS